MFSYLRNGLQQLGTEEMEYTLAGAAQATGIAKTTIFRAIKSGKISAKRLDDRTYRIDASELARVYPIAAMNRSTRTERNISQQDKKPGTPRVSEMEVAVLRTRLEMVEGQLTRERELRDQERESAGRERETTLETVTDLRRRLDRAEERVLALSAPPSPPPVPAAAVVEPIAPAPVTPSKPQAGFLARLFGRA